MSLSTDDYDRFIAQCAHNDPEQLQELLAVQRGLTEGLLTIAQYTVDDPEKQAVLDEIEEQGREVGLISSDEDTNECSCNCSCSSSASSLIESNASEDADQDAEDAGTAVDLDPTPGKILDAAAQAAANGTDDTDEFGEPSSGSLREYRERQAQANATEDTDADTDAGTPASLAEYRRTEDGKQAVEKKEARRPSLMDLLRAP